MEPKKSNFFSVRLTSLLCFLLFSFSLTAASAQSVVKLHNKNYVSLDQIGSSWGMELKWLQPKKQVLLFSKWTQVQCQQHQRLCLINGNKVYLGDPIATHKGQLWVSDTDYRKTLRPVLTPQVFSPKPKLYRIVLDPGHGGKDPGAENRSLKVNEKATTLDLALKMQNRLTALGYKVLLTRSDDTFISLSERGKFANRHNADLFISLHFNAVETKKVHGIETFVMTNLGQPSTARSKLSSSDKRSYAGNEDSAWSTLAGYYIQSSLVKNLKAKDRGLKRARFAVLRDLKCPGILVEGGFISNTEEGRKIKSSQYRSQMADAIVEGILTYQKTLNRVRQKG